MDTEKEVARQINEDASVNREQQSSAEFLKFNNIGRKPTPEPVHRRSAGGIGGCTDDVLSDTFHKGPHAGESLEMRIYSHKEDRTAGTIFGLTEEPRELHQHGDAARRVCTGCHRWHNGHGVIIGG